MFESGTPPVPNIYAGLAGMELMKQIGIGATEQHVRGLNDRLLDGLDELGAHVVTPRDPAQRGPLIAVASIDDHSLVAALAADRIIVSPRDGNVRISAHAYNSTEDIDAVLASLARHRELLA